jgi:hypothetical protein
MSSAVQGNNDDEIAKESIRSVTEIFNKGINGNPLALVSILIIVILSILLIGVFGSNLYFQFQNMQIVQDSTVKLNKNNELLQGILDSNKKTNDLLQKIIDSNHEVLTDMRYNPRTRKN